MNKDQQKIYRLQLTDGITTVSLGEYRAAGFADAEKKARTKYKSMFKRLRLPNWKVVEG